MLPKCLVLPSLFSPSLSISVLYTRQRELLFSIMLSSSASCATPLLRSSASTLLSSISRRSSIGTICTRGATQVSAAQLSTSTGTAVSVDSSSSSSSSNRVRNTTHEEYINFATRDAFLRKHSALSMRGGRRSRSRGSGPAEEEQLLRHNAKAVDPTDTYAGPPVFRRDLTLYTLPSKRNLPQSISVDVSAKRLLDMFCDFDTKRCKLCNEAFVQWHLHSSGIPHSGREGMLLELVRPFCGTPEEIVRRWNYRLFNSTALGRIPALSHPNNQIRQRRLKYLLHYLKDRGVLVDVFNLSNEANDAVRTFEFERLEFIGDGVVKYVLNNIINLIFPVSEGGIRGCLSNFQFVMDGNEGLARGYDFLELQDLTQSTRVVSKFKSDVVETLFGELQFFLWSSQLDVNTEPLAFPFTSDMYTLRAIVQHVMYETATVLFMYHVENVLGMLQRIVREEQLQYIKADLTLLQPHGRDAAEALQRHSRSSASGFDDDDDYNIDNDDYFGGGGRGGGRYGGSGVSLTITAPTRRLMKLRAARAHLQGGSAATFLESTNYDNYKRVVPIGGLLPRPFAREQLAVIPNYMPHVQRDEAMTQQVRDSADSWKAQLRSELAEETVEDAKAAASAVTDEAAYRLSPTPTAKAKIAGESLSVPRLKDEDLIAELI